LIFNFKVSAIVKELLNPNEQSSQDGRNLISSNVHCEIYYYPYVDGKETLPITIMEDEDGILINNKDDTVPLSERDFGFECYWNGRLLSNEKIPSLPFSKKPNSKSEIPDHCYRRIKGILFLDDAFEVSANKVL
jgi:structural maintenance of chromosomes flexible hinge domain-containing protein 1